MLSIVVAAHKDPEGVYLTVESLLQQIPQYSSDLQWELIIAADGGTDYKWEKVPSTRCLRIKTGSPQGTRDAGIRAAVGKWVLCVEAHVILFDIKAWFIRHVEITQGARCALSFPARVHEGPDLLDVYSSVTSWETLWYDHHLYAPRYDAHRVVQFGHSAFMVDRDWYLDSGGYTDLLKGWGGEEPFLCLKAWMLGRSCWMLPVISQAHYLTPGAHAGVRESESFKTNFKIVRYVMSGQVEPGLKVTPEMRAERARICAGPFKGDLAALREYFHQEGIK